MPVELKSKKRAYLFDFNSGQSRMLEYLRSVKHIEMLTLFRFRRNLKMFYDNLIMGNAYRRYNCLISYKK